MPDNEQNGKRNTSRAGTIKLALTAWMVMGLVSTSAGTIFRSDYDVDKIEESAGMSLAVFRDFSGDVYGGGYETGVRIIDTIIFGEIFGHWMFNRIESGTYYSVGVALRLMPRWDIAPFAGVGGAYNGLLSDRNDRLEVPAPRPAQSYWSAHAEGGLRYWFGTHNHFIEATYRHHYSDSGSDFGYGWFAIEYGRMF